MTKIPKPIKALQIANILKKSTNWKIQAYDNSILRGPDDSFSSLCRTMKETAVVEVRMIQFVIDYLKSEQKSTCKHPKSMHDTDPNGIVYCMKYGEDVQSHVFQYNQCKRFQD